MNTRCQNDSKRVAQTAHVCQNQSAVTKSYLQPLAPPTVAECSHLRRSTLHHVYWVPKACNSHSKMT